MPEDPTRAEKTEALDDAYRVLWTDDEGDPVYYTETPVRA